MSARVSVVVPTVGRASLHAALDSVRHQGVDVEILVVDDSGSGAVGEALGSDVHVIRTRGRVGAAEARNVGMAAATAEFIAFLDDDDVWLPGHLSDALALLEARPEVDVYAARGLVLDEAGRGRVEPTVLLGDRTVAQYFFERNAWRSRCRRIMTPTLVFRAALRSHPMEGHRAVNEDTWWLLTAERDRGAVVAQSSHIGAVVHGSGDRTTSRWSTDLGDWLDDVDALRPGAAAVEQLSMLARPAVRSGRPHAVIGVGRDVLGRPAGWTWLPVVGLHLAAAGAVGVARRVRAARRTADA
ncbi:glycosyltransferase family 2 protein [Agilicoccus flavus]|uniref:glycosyltransferase family 2 protein n=1 Tax=Agilicoccus flavus TaxID=2775968 RepID=UPI001CF68AFA|nr:glycosyltransferase family 2 protein [Agilicoccus flavus]